MQYILKLVVVLVLMAPSAGRAALIAYWAFNESGDTTANDSAGTYDGTLVNAASFVSGGVFYSRAYGVSADGSVVVGQSSGGSGNEAFRWTSGGGMGGLVE